MSIEPQNVRFQIGTRVLPNEAKTPADYQANLRRKYGKMPSMTELAKMENKTVSRSLNRPKDRTVTEADAHRLLALRQALAMKTRATLDRILACLTKPKTAAELEAETRLSRQAIGAHLRAAYDRGEINRTALKRITLWSRA